MQTLQIQTIVSNDGILTLNNLPFKAGEEVDVIIRSHQNKRKSTNRYPLRGLAFKYIDPFESVAEQEWEVLKPIDCCNG
jgi:hypothetical protein